MPPKAEPTLQVWERWLYGGLGSLAPIFVAALALDLATVFRSADMPAVAGWIARSVVLFVIGGFVAFLHKKETDAWRCFVIGIAAPALITTAISGRQLGRIAGSPSYISTAVAGEVPTTFGSSDIKSTSLAGLQETSASKFERGFLGRDPSRIYVVISLAFNEQQAKELAVNVYRYSQCAIRDPRNKQFSSSMELVDQSPPIIVSHDSVFAVVSQFSEPGAANNYVSMLRRNKQSLDLSLDTVSTTRARAQSDFLENVFSGLGGGDLDDLTLIKKWGLMAKAQCAAVGMSP
jgi:hypothetical protein